MAKNTKLLKKKMLTQMEKNLCIVSDACKSLNVSRATYYLWLNNDPEFKQAINDLNERVIDITERALLQRIEEGSEKAIFFHLKHKGQKRGYSNVQNINVEGNLAHSITLSIDGVTNLLSNPGSIQDINDEDDEDGDDPENSSRNYRE